MRQLLFDILIISIAIILAIFGKNAGYWLQDLTNAVNNLISITSGLTGILLAAVALLYSFKQNIHMERLKKSTQYPALLKTYTNALYWCGVILLTGVILQSTNINYVLPYWLSASIVILTKKFYLVIRITEKLLLLS